MLLVTLRLFTCFLPVRARAPYVISRIIAVPDAYVHGKKTRTWRGREL